MQFTLDVHIQWSSCHTEIMSSIILCNMPHLLPKQFMVPNVLYERCNTRYPCLESPPAVLKHNSSAFKSVWKSSDNCQMSQWANRVIRLTWHYILELHWCWHTCFIFILAVTLIVNLLPIILNCWLGIRYTRVNKYGVQSLLMLNFLIKHILRIMYSQIVCWVAGFWLVYFAIMTS